MRKFIMFITAVCVLFLIKLQWPKIRTNVFMIHHIISMLHCLDHSVKLQLAQNVNVYFYILHVYLSTFLLSLKFQLALSVTWTITPVLSSSSFEIQIMEYIGWPRRIHFTLGTGKKSWNSLGWFLQVKLMTYQCLQIIKALFSNSSILRHFILNADENLRETLCQYVEYRQVSYSQAAQDECLFLHESAANTKKINKREKTAAQLPKEHFKR